MSNGSPGAAPMVARVDDGSGDIILRLAPSAWMLAAIVFSLGVLVGLLID